MKIFHFNTRFLCISRYQMEFSQEQSVFIHFFFVYIKLHTCWLKAKKSYWSPKSRLLFATHLKKKNTAMNSRNFHQLLMFSRVKITGKRHVAISLGLNLFSRFWKENYSAWNFHIRTQMLNGSFCFHVLNEMVRIFITLARIRLLLLFVTD